MGQTLKEAKKMGDNSKMRESEEYPQKMGKKSHKKR